MKEPRKQYRKEKGIPEPKNMGNFPTHQEDKAYIEWLEYQLTTPTDHKELEESRINAEEDYVTTPISVLAYISKLESQSLQVSEWVNVEEFRPTLNQYGLGVQWSTCWADSLTYSVFYNGRRWECRVTGGYPNLTHILLPQPPKQK